MRKHLLCLILAAGMAGPSHAREVPEGVQRMIDTLLTDSMTDCGLAYTKRVLHLDSGLQLSDIEAGVPLEKYIFRYAALDTCDVNAPVQELIEPANVWLVPIRTRTKERYLYYVEVYKKGDVWKRIGMGEGDRGIWQRLRKAYPESTGVNPILVSYCGQDFLHFPQKGVRNLFSVQHLRMNRKETSSREKGTPYANMSYSLDTLDDSRPVVRYLKRQWTESRQKREEIYRKHPNLFPQLREADNE